jgi:hypothetical protein
VRRAGAEHATADTAWRAVACCATEPEPPCPAPAGPPACLPVRVVHTQAWNNFKQEWLQLRRSFRYDEFSRISSLNPPQGPFGKVSVCGYIYKYIKLCGCA